MRPPFQSAGCLIGAVGGGKGNFRDHFSFINFLEIIKEERQTRDKAEVVRSRQAGSKRTKKKKLKFRCFFSSCLHTSSRIRFILGDLLAGSGDKKAAARAAHMLFARVGVCVFANPVSRASRAKKHVPAPHQCSTFITFVRQCGSGKISKRFPRAFLYFTFGLALLTSQLCHIPPPALPLSPPSPSPSPPSSLLPNLYSFSIFCPLSLIIICSCC